MSRQIADLDFGRLSPRARQTLQEIVPLSEDGYSDAEIAARLRTDRRSIAERRAQLRFELEAQVNGAAVRPATEEEDEALEASIRELGQLVPGLVDDSGGIVAGNRRKRVCDKLGIEFRTVQIGSLDDAHDVAVAENLVRRHLSPSDRRRMIEAELIRRPDRSDRAIAATLGVSPTTVGVTRKQLEENGQVSRLDTRIGKDGKPQASRKQETERADEPDPETRLDYIALELQALADLDDHEHACARGFELVVEALRELGQAAIADAYKQLVYPTPGG